MDTKFGRLRRSVLRTAAASGLVVAAATTGVIVPGAANAADLPLGTYTASVAFADKFVQAGSAHTFDLTFTNTSNSTQYVLEEATASLAGFSVSGATASNGWTASVSGTTVTFAPGLIVDGLLAGQSLDVTVTATAPASLVGTNSIATTASGPVGLLGVLTDFDRQGDDPSMLVAPFATTDTCNAGEDCDTGYIGDPTHTEARATSGASASPDIVGITVGTDDGACGAQLQTTSKSRAVTVDSVATDRTVTVYIQLDKSKVNEAAPNGVGKVVICHESPKPFTDRNGNTVTSGHLPVCLTATSAGPCVVETHKTGAGDFYATIRQPGGDPKNVMGYPVPGT